jgi:hypothetical protein
MISSYWNRDLPESEPNGYLVYEISTGKVFELNIPDGFTQHRFLTERLDMSQGIVELKAYDRAGDIRDDVDIIIKESLGWYRVRQKP